jgi:hypothetical protein
LKEQDFVNHLKEEKNDLTTTMKDSVKTQLNEQSPKSNQPDQNVAKDSGGKENNLVLVQEPERNCLSPNNSSLEEIASISGRIHEVDKKTGKQIH